MTPDWLVLGGALLTGLMGSAHCAAMCGGIATGFSVQQRGGWWVALQPNLGRIGGYALAGAIVGGFGQAMLGVARSPTLMIATRAAVGLVLVFAALRLLDRSGRFAFLGTPGAAAWKHLRPLHRHLLPANTVGKRLAIGMLWGWMPCGLSTHLLAAAWLQADAWQGAATMLAFGLATLPMMLPLTWAGARVGQRLQRGAWRMSTGLLVLAAGLATLAAPWLLHAPALHDALVALGCRSAA
jgi:sulfite exporter TauE/SafE